MRGQPVGEFHDSRCHHNGDVSSSTVTNTVLAQRTGLVTIARMRNRLRELREARGLSQPELAGKMNTTRQQISRLELSERRLSDVWIERATKALGVSVAELFGETPPPPQAVEPAPDPAEPLPPPNARRPPEGQAPTYGPRDLPIRGRAQGGPDGVIHLGDGTIEWTWRSPELAGVREAYALYVDGDSMKNFGKPHGTTVFVHPYRRPRPEQFCVVVLKSGAAYIKRMVRQSQAKLIVEQSNPPKTLEFPISELEAVHLVTGQSDPT